MTLVSAAFCLALAAPAGANTFLIVESSPDAWTVIDPATIVREAGGGQLTAWTVTVQRNLTNSLPPQPGYIRTLNDYDCSGWRIRWRSFLAYSRFGALVIKKDNGLPDWAPVPNGGPGDANLRLLCGGGAGGGSVVAAGSIGKLVIGLMQAWDPPAEAEPVPPPLQLPPPPPAQPKPRASKRPTH